MDDFAFCANRAIVLGLLRREGYDAVTPSAAEALVSLLETYLQTITRTARRFTEHTGRVQSNIADVNFTFVELGVRPRELLHEIRRKEGSDIGKIELQRAPERENRPQLIQTGPIEKPPSYVPKFFPLFPDPHTYRSTPVVASLEEDPIRALEKRVIERRTMEDNLRKLFSDGEVSRSILGRIANYETTREVYDRDRTVSAMWNVDVSADNERSMPLATPVQS